VGNAIIKDVGFLISIATFCTSLHPPRGPTVTHDITKRLFVMSVEFAFFFLELVLEAVRRTTVEPIVDLQPAHKQVRSATLPG
jgi:hypothetical protein